MMWFQLEIAAHQPPLSCLAEVVRRSFSEGGPQAHCESYGWQANLGGGYECTSATARVSIVLEMLRRAWTIAVGMRAKIRKGHQS
jgi:hypothetical protein